MTIFNKAVCRLTTIRSAKNAIRINRSCTTKSSGSKNKFNKDSFDSFFSSIEGFEMDWSSMQKFNRNIYKEHPETAAQPEEEIISLMRQNNIDTSEITRPIRKFDHLGVDERLINALLNKFKEPTLIQQFSWPYALSGKNLVGLSYTGSGKTLSFGVPMVEHIFQNMKKGNSKQPIGLVLTPTWELCKQVHKDIGEIGKSLGVKGACFHGGDSLLHQRKLFMYSYNFIVATPGRLMDAVRQSVLELSNISFLVVDEGDRMVDMGFEPQIRALLSFIRPDRQFTMWSATWPRSVSSIAAKYISDPVKIKVGSGTLEANKDIKQTVMLINDMQKSVTLKKILTNEDYRKRKTLIFVNRIVTAETVVNYLKRSLINVEALHGDKDKRDRSEIYSSFTRGKVNVLVATDVASRGIDVSDISLVIIYDFPLEIDSYIHRIGRTGRAGKNGEAITFFGKDDVNHAVDLCRILRKSGQKVPEPLEKLVSMILKQQG